jgi:SAM-dependent methyltransferase
MSAPSPIDDFLGRLRTALGNVSLVRLTLGKYRGPDPDLERVTVRPVRVRETELLAFVTRHRTRDITRNLTPAEGVTEIGRLLASGFRAATLFLTGEELQLTLNRRGEGRVQCRKVDPVAAKTTAHDRTKRRELDPGLPFLRGLGVTDERGRVLPSMAAKWRQINRFLEVFATDFNAAGFADGTAARVVDFGCGKGYLTFAVHEWLRRSREGSAEVIGVELRPALVDTANRVAREAGHAGLEFRAGDIARHPPGPMDVMIALHACDTATDLALHTGICAGARLLMCAPCCHKEIRPQIQPPEVLQPVLRHGVHRGAEADMLTDSMRALLLEIAGYDVKIFEFISLEHTSKNRMITAVKSDRPRRADAARGELARLKEFYSIRDQTLNRLFTTSGDA